MSYHRLPTAPLASHPRGTGGGAVDKQQPQGSTYLRPNSVQSNGATSADLEKTRAWAAGLVRWDNFDHHHSRIRYISPADRHAGRDREILAARHALYTQARELNPARWSGKTRHWSPIGAVTLNPERDSVVMDCSRAMDKQPRVA